MPSGMAAMASASSAPTPRPNRMPSGSDFTFREKNPMRMPPTNPLNVDPIMMVAISGRTSGVNQAVPPSMAPNTVPSRSPSSTLFITFLRSGSLSLLFLTTEPQNPLGLSVQEKQNQHAHRQVRCNQQDKEAVTAVKTRGLLKNTLAVGADGEAVQVAG